MQIVMQRIKLASTHSARTNVWISWIRARRAITNARKDIDIRPESISVWVSSSHLFSLWRFPFYRFCLLNLTHMIWFESPKKNHHEIVAQKKDINECSEGSHECDSQTQLCLNTRGGYKCQEKIDKIGDKCLPGLKFDEETKLCEGWCSFFSLFAHSISCIVIYFNLFLSLFLWFLIWQNRISRISLFFSIFDFHSHTLPDINECQLDPDSCDDGYKCINTVGSFECIQLNIKNKKWVNEVDMYMRAATPFTQSQRVIQAQWVRST